MEFVPDSAPVAPGDSLKKKVISTMSPIDKLGVGLTIRWLKKEGVMRNTIATMLRTFLGNARGDKVMTGIGVGILAMVAVCHSPEGRALLAENCETILSIAALFGAGTAVGGKR